MLLFSNNVAGGTAGKQPCRRTACAHMRPSRRCAVKVTSANDGWQSNGSSNGSHYGNGNGNGNGNGSYYPPPYQQQQQPSFTIPFLPSMPRMPQPALAVDSNFKASGKTVVITGGSQGIGRATALVFARKGYNVVVAARDPTKLQYVAQDVAQLAGRQGASLAVPTDVTSEREVKDLVNATLAKFESVDVVINCAGIMARGAFQDTPLAEAKRLIDVNYLGAYAVTQNFLPILAASAKKRVWMDRPSVVMVNSFAGKVPTKYMSAFTASKFALAGLAEAIRLELEPMGVHVSQVHPGFVKSNVLEHTEFYGSNSTDDRRSFRQVLRSLPISQSPQEVADAIFNAVASKQGDVTVGIPFMAAEAAFRVTGLNPTAMPFT